MNYRYRTLVVNSAERDIGDPAHFKISISPVLDNVESIELLYFSGFKSDSLAEAMFPITFSDESIYSGDGVITSPVRTVQGSVAGTNTLAFSRMANFNVTTGDNIQLTAPTIVLASSSADGTAISQGVFRLQNLVPTLATGEQVLVLDPVNKVVSVRDMSSFPFAAGPTQNVYNYSGTLTGDRIISGNLNTYDLNIQEIKTLVLDANTIILDFGTELRLVGTGPLKIQNPVSTNILSSQVLALNPSNFEVEKIPTDQLPNIYNHDDVLTDDRIVSGNLGARSISFQQMNTFFVEASSILIDAGTEMRFTGSGPLLIQNAVGPTIDITDYYLMLDSVNQTVHYRIPEEVATFYNKNGSITQNRVVTGDNIHNLTFDSFNQTVFDVADSFILSGLGTLQLSLTLNPNASPTHILTYNTSTEEVETTLTSNLIPAPQNIYNSNGTITAPVRTVSGDIGNTLNFNNFAVLSFTQLLSFNVTTDVDAINLGIGFPTDITIDGSIYMPSMNLLNVDQLDDNRAFLALMPQGVGRRVATIRKNTVVYSGKMIGTWRVSANIIDLTQTEQSLPVFDLQTADTMATPSGDNVFGDPDTFRLEGFVNAGIYYFEINVVMTQPGNSIGNGILRLKISINGGAETDFLVRRYRFENTTDFSVEVTLRTFYDFNPVNNTDNVVFKLYCGGPTALQNVEYGLHPEDIGILTASSNRYVCTTITRHWPRTRTL